MSTFLCHLTYSSVSWIPFAHEKDGLAYKSTEHKTRRAGHDGAAYNPSVWEGEAGGWGAQGDSWIYSKFETSLGYIWPVSGTKRRLENNKNKSQKKTVQHCLAGNVLQTTPETKLCQCYERCVPCIFNLLLRENNPPTVLLIFTWIRSSGLQMDRDRTNFGNHRIEV